VQIASTNNKKVYSLSVGLFIGYSFKNYYKYFKTHGYMWTPTNIEKKLILNYNK